MIIYALILLSLSIQRSASNIDIVYFHLDVKKYLDNLYHIVILYKITWMRELELN
jgi:hypothetical protein